MMEILSQSAGLVFTPYVMAVILAASIFGLFVGAIPGLSATMAAALLVPVTFFMDPVPALGAIIATSAMALFAGDIPAALLRMPGTPSSAAYVDDLHRLTREGKIARALGACLLFSASGGLIASVILILGAPLLARFAANFSSDEYFWLACLGLSCAVIIFAHSPLKGLISLLIGLLIATIGTDLSTGYARYTFGYTNLIGGIGFIPAVIGMFAFAEILKYATSTDTTATREPMVNSKAGGFFAETIFLFRNFWRNHLRGSFIGTVTGVLPGAGGGVATWISYAISLRFAGKSKDPDIRALGSITEASSANNSSLGGAWIPTLVFGIPGDAITAVVLGVLLVHGITPGPQVFVRTPELVYSLFIIFILANLLMIPLGILAIRWAGVILRVPRAALMSVIVLIAIIGAFAVNNALFDVGVMLSLGFLAFLMQKYGFPVAPTILALVLAPIVEQNFLMSLMKARGSLTGLVDRPVAIILAIMTISMWLMPVYGYFRRYIIERRKQSMH